MKVLWTSENLGSRFQIIFDEESFARFKNIHGNFLNTNSMSWESAMSDEQIMRLTFLNEYARFQNQKGQYLAMNEEKKLYFEGAEMETRLFLVQRNFFGPCLFLSSPLSFSLRER